MKTAKLIILDEVNIKFDNLDIDTRNKIYKKLEYMIPYARHLPSYKLGRWDGKVSFANRGGKTALNLLDRILPIIDSSDYKLEIEDHRTEIDLSFPEITETMFSHICWPAGHQAEGQPIILRDYQVNAIKTFIKNPQCIQEISTGAGKCQPYNSKVLTNIGWQIMKNIKKGDIVITPDGKKSKVLATFEPGNKDVYEITFSDGRAARCCADHIWKVYNINWRPSTKKSGPWRYLTTTKLIDLKKKTKRSIGIPLPSMTYDVEDKKLPLDPWLLGFLLGNGSFRNTIGFSTSDIELVEKVNSKLKPEYTVKYKNRYDYSIVFKRKEDFKINQSKHMKNKNRNSLGHIISEKDSFHYYKRTLMDLGLFGKHSDSKFIPEEYFSGSVEQRKELIRGLVDSDGTIDKSSIKFTSVSKQLALDFQRLVRSVGGVAKISMRKNSIYKYKEKYHPCKDFYTVTTKFPEPWDLISLKRKKDQTKYQYQYNNTLKLNIIDIKKVSNEPVKCIYIDDPNHLYLTDDYIVTHNTLITACLSKLCEPYGRTVVIVPNRDLVIQTEADYKNLGLNVGVFYGGRREWNKTHTICTWQSLNAIERIEKTKKKNNEEVLTQEQISEFLKNVMTVIVDETHAAKGDVLKKMLMGPFRNCPIRWGLSGTIPKDEWEFLHLLSAIGPVAQQITAKELQDKDVLANCHVELLQTQEVVSFNRYQDELKFLLTDKNRLEFIASLISNIALNGNTLILVQQIKTGEFLNEMIKNSVFINGSVKSEERKEEYTSINTENNKVIIATYGVASTGINIPRIFNLVLFEPGKSFIRTIQSIGRGLRRAKDKDFVQIYDICASTKYSKKHLTERKKFYKDAQYPFNLQKIKYL